MTTRRVAVGALLLLLLQAPSLLAQTAPAAAPTLSEQQMEAFLRNGRIVSRRTGNRGVTDAFRVTLSDGTITHDAQVQNVDISRAVFDVGPKFSEVGFRDSYKYNIAGYRLARMIGMSNVPMSVPRTVDGKPSAMTWWIDDVAFDEGGRTKAGAAGPNPQRTAAYIHILRVFDELIQNRDRNTGNFLWTKDWTMWLIDHTRAFRIGKELLKPQLLERCERSMCAGMRALTREALERSMADLLTEPEIDGLMARRDLILKLFDEKIAQRGEGAVLFTLPSP
jgi:hypothetical protein